MDFTTTEGLERFNKIVSYMGLFVPPDEQTMIEQNKLGADEDGTYPAVHAYVNEDCWKNNRGHLIALIDEAVFICVLKHSMMVKIYFVMGQYLRGV